MRTGTHTSLVAHITVRMNMKSMLTDWKFCKDCLNYNAFGIVFKYCVSFNRSCKNSDSLHPIYLFKKNIFMNR